MNKNSLLPVYQTRNLAKAKEKHSKQKATEYCSKNNEGIKKKSQKSDRKTCLKKKKTRLKSTKEKDISN